MITHPDRASADQTRNDPHRCRTIGTTRSGHSPEWEERYRKQLLLAEIGPSGQEKLRQGSVLVVGCGGLGSTAALLLVRGGIGFLRLVDRDVVEVENLHRQLLYNEADASERIPKVVAAKRELRAINEGVEIDACRSDVRQGNIEDLLRGIDVTVDGTDNFRARCLINEACVKLKKPWVYGGVVGTTGMAMMIVPGRGPCLWCLFPSAPEDGVLPSSDRVGLVNTLPALIGAVQVTMAMKLLVGAQCEPGRLFQFDPWIGEYNQISVPRDPACPVCVEQSFRFLGTPPEGS